VAPTPTQPFNHNSASAFLAAAAATARTTPLQINPCNSMLHPAVEAGIPPEGGEELSVQQAYTPKSQCFGCGESVRQALL
jgi:hypothetical protein